MFGFKIGTKLETVCLLPESDQDKPQEGESNPKVTEESCISSPITHEKTPTSSNNKSKESAHSKAKVHTVDTSVSST